MDCSKFGAKKREARKSLRQPAWITLEGGFAVRACVVEDLSASGAKITVEDNNTLPAKLRLAFSRDARNGRRLRSGLAPRPDRGRQVRRLDWAAPRLTTSAAR